MYSPYYSYGYSSYSAFSALPIVMIAAIIAAIVLYCTFLRKENEGKYTGWKEVVYNFFNFNRFYLEEIIKLFYILLAAVIVAYGLVMLFVTPLTGILILVVGNVVARISYEAIMMFVILCKKTVSLDRKIDKITVFYEDSFGEDEFGEDEFDEDNIGEVSEIFEEENFEEAADEKVEGTADEEAEEALEEASAENDDKENKIEEKCEAKNEE